MTKVRRVIPPGITHLEVWDCELGPDTLWDRMYRTEFPSDLLETIERILEGKAVSRSSGPLETKQLSFDSIFISGGGVSKAITDTLSKNLDLPIIMADDPVFGSIPGGHKLLPDNGISGMVVDVGQSQIKISHTHELKTYSRDFDILPLRTEDIDASNPEYKEAFCQYVSNSMRDAKKSAFTGDVVIALPCSLDASGSLGSCSYPGMGRDLTIVEDICEMACDVTGNVPVVNDAELAALSARCNERIKGSRTILVLTIGFGVGCTVMEDAL